MGLQKIPATGIEEMTENLVMICDFFCEFSAVKNISQILWELNKYSGV